MITSFFYKKGGEVETNLSRARLLSALGEKDGLLWVDLEDPSKFESDTLVEIFNFHPLAVEDCINEHSEPKACQVSIEHPRRCLPLSPPIESRTNTFELARP